jgi:hypothetical protein
VRSQIGAAGPWGDAPAAKESTMKVKELMAILEEQDQDADVIIVTQANWPFENSVHGVTTRQECMRDGEDGEDESADDKRTETRRADGTDPSDVFIVEGDQLRYGTKRAWDVAES